MLLQTLKIIQEFQQTYTVYKIFYFFIDKNIFFSKYKAELTGIIFKSCSSDRRESTQYSLS